MILNVIPLHALVSPSSPPQSLEVFFMYYFNSLQYEPKILRSTYKLLQIFLVLFLNITLNRENLWCNISSSFIVLALYVREKGKETSKNRGLECAIGLCWSILQRITHTFCYITSPDCWILKHLKFNLFLKQVYSKIK